MITQQTTTVVTVFTGAKKIALKIWQCADCNGTGLWVGTDQIPNTAGIALVCNHCQKGATLKETGIPFTGIRKVKGVERVAVENQDEPIPYESWLHPSH